MRPGGESGKFGNDYEASWTVSNLLRIVDGSATEMESEPIDDGIGIEFTITQATGVREHHSAKIQTTATHWSVAMLIKMPPDRSIAGDLFNKLAKFPADEAVFVSEVGAQPLQGICEAARRAANDADFMKRLNATQDGDFNDTILPYFKDVAVARDHLRRLHVIPAYQATLDRDIDSYINRLFVRTDNQPLAPADVRLHLKDLILDNLGKKITKAGILAELKNKGYEPGDYQANQTVLDNIKARNEGYNRSTTRFLINRKMIRRKEAADAFTRLQTGDVKFGAFVGAAGLGKSCAMAELYSYLDGGKMPCLALRLDTSFTAITAQKLGLEMGLPASPVHVLGKASGGRPCVLILDQLDALSIISGRSRKLWEVVDELLEEVRNYPNMRVWIGCRSFDLENDPMIMQMIKDRGVERVELKPLTIEEVKAQVKEAKLDPDVLDKDQLEVLRTPMHLSIYLDGQPGPAKPFRTVLDLYDAYWDRKQQLLTEKLGREVRWTDVIDLLSDELTMRQTLSAPVSIFDGTLHQDAMLMVSENVLTIDGKVCRFFHEGFFDYAFARRFVRKGRKLAEFLLSSGEQVLFRRAQVRQVLTYLRSGDRTVYLAELASLLKTEGIRAHILQLVYQWLGELPDPTKEELEVLALKK